LDPGTVVIILAANLICTGGLFYLIGRRMPVRNGVTLWAVGSLLFGLAYMVRLAGGTAMGGLGHVVVDTAMVVGALLFLGGLRRWVGKRTVPRRGLLGLAAGYAVLHGLAVAGFGSTGRFFLLNLTLAVVYALIAINGAIARSQHADTLKPPLLVLTWLMGALALLTGLRAAGILHYGLDAMNQGLAAQIYYGYASLAVVLMAMTLLWMLFVRLNGQLQELASRDALTRVLNRNGLDDALNRHFGARNALPVTLIEVDVDHFKRINDEHGHAVGDAVLRAVAEAIARRVRGNDFVARVGGEEFLVGCVDGGTDSHSELAVNLGQRLRAGVAELQCDAP
jgi:diguanylate cyclase (GGDEF)-like protein